MVNIILGCLIVILVLYICLDSFSEFNYSELLSLKVIHLSSRP